MADDDVDYENPKTLQEALELLESKERDLELAARIGQALLEENEQLRSINDAETSGNSKFKHIEEQLYQSKEKNLNLENRVSILNSALQKSDHMNASLQAKIDNLEDDLSEKSAAYINLKADYDQLFRDYNNSSGNANNSKGISLSRSISGDSDNSVNTWQNRAEHAELKLQEHAERTAMKETSYENRITKLMNELHLVRDKEAELQSQMTDLNAELVIVRDDAENLRWQNKNLLDEREILENDLVEHKRILSSKISNKQPPSETGDSENELDVSLADELRLASSDIPLDTGTVIQTKQKPEPMKDDTISSLKSFQGLQKPKTDTMEVSKQVRSESPRHSDIDPYYFHFHMTANTVKSEIAMGGHRDTDLFSDVHIDLVNSMDTQAMYDEVVAKAIPPNLWPGYIRDQYRKKVLENLVPIARTHLENTNRMQKKSVVSKSKSKSARTTFEKLMSLVFE